MPTLIPRIPIIPTLILRIPIIPTLIPRISHIAILIPRIPIIPLILFPDFPFRLLQIASYFLPRYEGRSFFFFSHTGAD